MSKNERVLVVIVRLTPIDPVHPGGEHAVPDSRDMIADAVTRALKGARIASEEDTDLAAELDVRNTPRVQAIENEAVRRVETSLQESYDRLKGRLVDFGATGVIAAKATSELLDEIRVDANEKLNKAMLGIASLWQRFCPSEEVIKALAPRVIVEVIWRTLKEFVGP